MSNVDNVSEQTLSEKRKTYFNIQDTPSPAVKLVLDRFEVELKKLGVPFYMVGNTGVEFVLPGGNGYRFSNWPKPLLDTWAKHRGFSLDPIIQHGRTAKDPFFWHDDTLDVSRFSTRLLKEANSYGLSEGYVVPAIDKNGAKIAIVSIGGPSFSFTPEMLSTIETLCRHFLKDLSLLYPPRGSEILATLTLQEREVLQCAGVGCSIIEIGEIIGISTSAVKDAQMRARKKLDARNTTHACVIATKFGLI